MKNGFIAVAAGCFPVPLMPPFFPSTGGNSPPFSRLGQHSSTCSQRLPSHSTSDFLDHSPLSHHPRPPKLKLLGVWSRLRTSDLACRLRRELGQRKNPPYRPKRPLKIKSKNIYQRARLREVSCTYPNHFSTLLLTPFSPPLRRSTSSTRANRLHSSVQTPAPSASL